MRSTRDTTKKQTWGGFGTVVAGKWPKDIWTELDAQAAPRSAASAPDSVARCVAALESLPTGTTATTSQLAEKAGVNASSGLLRHPELLRRQVKLLNKLIWGSLATIDQIRKRPDLKISDMLRRSAIESEIRANERRAIRHRREY